MKPHGTAVVVGRGNGTVPGVADGVCVEFSAQTRDGVAHRYIRQANRTAAIVRGPSVGIDRLQRPDKRGEIACGAHRIFDPFERGHFPGQPTHDGPRIRERLCRRTAGYRHRHVEGQLRREPRQPLLFLRHHVERPVDARQAHGQLVAKAIHRVVGAG